LLVKNITGLQGRSQGARASPIEFCLALLQQVLSGLGTHVFVKVPRPGNSEGTFSIFESSCHLLLPL